MARSLRRPLYDGGYFPDHTEPETEDPHGGVTETNPKRKHFNPLNLAAQVCPDTPAAHDERRW